MPYMCSMTKPLLVRALGRQPYEPVWRAMQAFTDGRGPETPDELWMVEHDPVFTLGQAGRWEHVLLPGEIPVVPVDRGGQVTYHGPGQIVGYPILDLKPDRCDVHRYVRDVEELMIRVCADYGVAAERVKGLTGTWVGPDKIGAIGVRISRWITSHGFAFNVSTNLDHFGLIVPCGIADRGVTSLERATGRHLSIAEVEHAIVRHFADVFERDPRARDGAGAARPESRA